MCRFSGPTWDPLSWHFPGDVYITAMSCESPTWSRIAFFTRKKPVLRAENSPWVPRLPQGRRNRTWIYCLPCGLLPNPFLIPIHCTAFSLMYRELITPEGSGPQRCPTLQSPGDLNFVKIPGSHPQTA